MPERAQQPPRPRGGRGHGAVAEAVQDCGFLGLMVAIASAPYVARLGFYSDDWEFLGLLRTAREASFAGQFRAIYAPDLLMRPVEAGLFTLVYHLFGAVPLAYHLLNAAALAVGAALFHLVLRELRFQRAVALAVPLIYAFLPHYSTDRFWPSALKITCSMTLYFLSLFAQLRASRAEGRLGAIAWWTLAIVAGTGLALAYEVFVPLLLMSPIVIWFQALRPREGAMSLPSSRPAAVGFSVLAALALAPALAFKAAVTERMVHREPLTHLLWLLRSLRDLAVLHAWPLGLLLPRGAWQVGHATVELPALLSAAACGCASYWYLARMGSRVAPEVGASPRWFTLVGIGLVVWVAGFAVFLVTEDLEITAAGIGNRTTIAAAVGIAMVWIGLTAGAASLFPTARARIRGFAAGTAALVVLNAFVNGQLAGYWVEAYARAHAVLSAIRHEFPDRLPPGALLLDGVCRFVGPAVIFEAPWDLSGALDLTYARPGVRADVIAPGLSVSDSALLTTVYHEQTAYRFKDGVLVYDPTRRSSHALVDAGSARRYLARRGPDARACPPGESGFGVPVFGHWR